MSRAQTLAAKAKGIRRPDNVKYLPKNWELASVAKDLFGSHRIRKEAHGRYVKTDFTPKEQAAIVAKVQSGNAVTAPAPTATKTAVWSAYDSFRAQYPAPKTTTAPRGTPLPNPAPKQARGNTRVPYHVLMAMAAANGNICPVYNLPYGTIMQRGNTSKVAVLYPVPDRIVPGAAGGKYVPGNVRVMSNLANGLKLHSTSITDAEIMQRSNEIGWHEAQPLTDDQKTLLRNFGVRV